MMKRKLIRTIIAAVCFFAAICITLYPVVSNYINEKYQSEIRTAYVEVVEQADNTELSKEMDLAIAYNQSIIPGTSVGDTYSQAALLAASEDYDSQLNMTGDGLMGYVEVPKIEVRS